MSSPVPPRKAPDEPWRTEGTPEEPPKPPPGGRKLRGGWWSLILAALMVYLIANLVLSFFNEGNEPTISYRVQQAGRLRERHEDLLQGRRQPGERGGHPRGQAPAAAPETLDTIEHEMRRIVDECYDEACRKLRDHRGQLDALTEALLANQTLEETDAYRIAGITRLTKGE